MTNKNSPNVNTVIGKVKITNIGFKKALSNANTIAKIIADVNPATSTPGRKLANTTTATAVKSNLMIKFIVMSLGVDEFKGLG